MLALVSIHQSFTGKVKLTSGVKSTDLKAVSAELKSQHIDLDLGVGGPPFLGLGDSVFL